MIALGGASGRPLCHSLVVVALGLALPPAAGGLPGCAEDPATEGFEPQCQADDDCEAAALEHGYDAACATWSCAEGLCAFDGEPFQDQPCDDGSACTVADSCYQRRCLGAPVDCNDGISCTSDSCDPETGACAHDPGPDCTCDVDEDCSSAIPADKCAGPLRCFDHQCQADTSQPILCDPALTHGCALATCDPLTGTCAAEAIAEGEPCGLDDNPCVPDGTCSEGTCAGELLDCNDDNPCTIDVCDDEEGGCRHEPLPGTCDDGDACTQNDVCDAAGACHGQPTTCDDGNVCTLGLCEAQTGLCSFVLLAGGCDDGSICTEEDTCHDGACLGVPVDCGDGDPCTKDLCVASDGGAPELGGCQHVPHPGPCDDGDPCTEGDTCAEGLCEAGEDLCHCHADADCDPLEEGDLCVGDLSCDTSMLPWSCQPLPGTAVTCGASGSPCEPFLCQPSTGLCASTPLEDGTTCDDADPCTHESACIEGICAPGLFIDCDDADPCTADSCELGACIHKALTGGETFLAEGFDGGWPADWAVVTTASSDAVWVASPDFDVEGEGFGLVATGAGATYGGPVQTVTRSPSLALWGETLAVTFMSRSELADSGCTHDRMVFGVDVGGAFTPLEAVCPSESQWTFHEVDLSSFSGATLRLVFVFEADEENNAGFGVAIDQVTTIGQFTCDDEQACTLGDTCFFGVCSGEVLEDCE